MAACWCPRLGVSTSRACTAPCSRCGNRRHRPHRFEKIPSDASQQYSDRPVTGQRSFYLASQLLAPFCGATTSLPKYFLPLTPLSTEFRNPLSLLPECVRLFSFSPCREGSGVSRRWAVVRTIYRRLFAFTCRSFKFRFFSFFSGSFLTVSPEIARLF